MRATSRERSNLSQVLRWRGPRARLSNENGATGPQNQLSAPQPHPGPQSAHSSRFAPLDRPFRAKATGNAKTPQIARKPAPALARAKFIHSPRPCQFDHLPTTGSYYLIHICVAALVAYAVTGNLWASLTLSLLEPTVQAVAFFFHEKAWDRAGRRAARQSATASPSGSPAVQGA